MEYHCDLCSQQDIDYLKKLRQIELGWNEGDEEFNHVRKITVNKEIVALLEYNCLVRDYIMEITLFEVIKDMRSEGIGTAIIREIQTLPNISVYQVLPRNENSKKFWERLGFIEKADGIGESIWIYSK